MKHLLAALAGVALAATPCAHAKTEAFEIGPSNTASLPGGKEADGVIGDFVLRNDLVEAVISHNAPNRRANMSTFYGPGGATPGCLYDLSLRGASNDQITIFSPLGQQGPVSFVRVTRDGRDGEAVVVATTSAESNNGVFKRHEYRLRDGMRGVEIVTTVRNTTDKAIKIPLADRVTRFASTGLFQGVRWADAEDPADKAGYAWGWPELPGWQPAESDLALEPGGSVTLKRLLVVGTSPAEAVGQFIAHSKPTWELTGRISGADQNDPATAAKILVSLGADSVPAYPDAKGDISMRLPSGEVKLNISDIGRERREIEIGGGDGTAHLAMVLGPAAGVAFDIRDSAGAGIPCKAQFIGVNGTPTPDLGPANRAHGCKDQWHSATGQFKVPLDPGTYKIIVTRGIEHDHLEGVVEVAKGVMTPFAGTLRRSVDTTGWISADYHNHSTPSGDNTCGTADRVINLAAEHIEFAPTTEHNRLFDWRPVINSLGLSHVLQTVSGMELTGSGPHLNSFPFEPQPFRQDNGAPEWNRDPRISALTLRRWQGENPHRWIQINHPDMVENFFDRDGDGKADGGWVGVAGHIDGLETENFTTQDMLDPRPYHVAKNRSGTEYLAEHRPFVWLQLLNQGARLIGMAVADAHSVHGNGVGGWRMYFPSSSDNPAEIDWKENVRHAKAGRSFLTTGPFLSVTTPDGATAGDFTRANGAIQLHVKVQCADWIDIDRVQVLVNGRQIPSLNFTRASHPDWFKSGVVKFDRSIEVPLSQDAHLIVVAKGENFDLKTGYGTSDQAKLKPCAYHNPIYVDVDGGGFTPNGDNLGFDLPVKVSIPRAREILAKAGFSAD